MLLIHSKMSSIKNVVVGISGGVDSAVAALLLKKKGFKVTGVYMKNWDLADENGICSVSSDLEDAKFACNRLKIPFHEVNFVKEYWNEVFVNFTEDYQNGMTPNPDILCNKYIKFKSFFSYAFKTLQTDAIATGHYAKSSFGPYLENYEVGKGVKLFRAKDTKKDQTFFLSQVSQESLRKVMFPLGNLLKSEVKKIATENGLEKLAKKPESMGICFIGSRRFQSFINEYVTPKPGKFINVGTGKDEGVHNGIHMWTVGQRCKIAGSNDAMYVVRKNPNTSDIFVAPGVNHPALYSSIFYSGTPHWLGEPPDLTYKAVVDFKFQHVKSLTKCDIVALKDGTLIALIARPLRALTPGQYAVFYNGNECLGSARIQKVGPLEFSLGKLITNDYAEYIVDADTQEA